jgi:6-phosphogluconolactonase (cycloisomerase 2 family)
LWLDTDTGKYFVNYDGQFIEIGVQGERGATGSTGPQGQAGATGSAGPTGAIAAHASTHATGGSDAITPSAIGAAPAASPTFTGVVTVAAGTAALPALVPSGDANTGFLFPAADTVAISTAGSERVRVKDNGVVRYVPIATEPSTAESGDVYYHSGLRRMRMFNGFRWQSLAVSGQEWNVSAASFVRSFSVATQEATPQGVFFKPDGTKMYIVGISSSPRSVREYSLTIAWDISTAAHSQSFAVNNEDTAPTSVFFKPDGTKMYVAGDTGNDINEYTLSTAWDISTATFVQAYVINSQEANIAGIFFRDDGVKMYMTGITSDNVNEYTLSTAWDVSTATFVQAFSVAGQETSPHGLFFKPDGRRMYIVGNVGDDVTEYDLSTAWDISTATHTTERSVSAQDNDPRCVFFRPDGLMMYIAGNQNDSVYQYTLQ